jgi:hypothetical protein
VPVPELERRLRATNDASGHRIDPWLTAIPLSMCLAFAATAGYASAVLTGPAIAIRGEPTMAGQSRPVHINDMAAVTVEHHQLIATAGLAWNTDLPRQLQQILFETADSITAEPTCEERGQSRVKDTVADTQRTAHPALGGCPEPGEHGRDL